MRKCWKCYKTRHCTIFDISMRKWQNFNGQMAKYLHYNHLVSPAFRDNPLSHIGFCGFALASLFCRRKSSKACDCVKIWNSQRLRALSTIMVRDKELEKLSRNIQTCCWHSPGVIALQLILQPVFVPLRSVLNTSLTMLLVLVMSAGRVVPQLFSIKVVPFPSVIVRWS